MNCPPPLAIIDVSAFWVAHVEVWYLGLPIRGAILSPPVIAPLSEDVPSGVGRFVLAVDTSLAVWYGAAQALVLILLAVLGGRGLSPDPTGIGLGA